MEDVLIILVAEDDQLIQAMVEEALSDGGFETSVAASGEQAIALLRGNKSNYRALITDINLLGRLDGWEVAQVARELNPALPLIYMTGTNGEEWPSRGAPKCFARKAICTRPNRYRRSRASERYPA